MSEFEKEIYHKPFLPKPLLIKVMLQNTYSENFVRVTRVSDNKTYNRIATEQKKSIVIVKKKPDWTTCAAPSRRVKAQLTSKTPILHFYYIR